MRKNAPAATGPTTASTHVDGVDWPKGKKRRLTVRYMQGSLVKADTEKRYSLGIVYEPDVCDSQGDYATAAEVERACWAFNLRLQGKDPVTKAALNLIKRLAAAEPGEQVAVEIPEAVDITKGALGVQHSNWDDDNGQIVESYITPADMVIGGQTVQKGTWLMGAIWNPDLWARIKSGALSGLSMGGQAQRVDTEIY